MQQQLIQHHNCLEPMYFCVYKQRSTKLTAMCTASV